MAGAGKTEFIRSVSQIGIISTERKATDETRLLKSETVAVLDYGRVAIAEDLLLHLYGVPGQVRFDFLWEIVAQGLLGLIVLVDSTCPETFRETGSIVEFFQDLRPMPFVIAASKHDHPARWSPAELHETLRLAPGIAVLPCIATERASVIEVLLHLLSAVMEQAP